MSFKLGTLLLVLMVFPLMVALSLWITVRVYRGFRAHRQRIREATEPYCPSVRHQWTYVIPRVAGTGLLWLKALFDPWVLLIVWKKTPDASLPEVFFKLTLVEVLLVLVLVWIGSIFMELEWAVDQRGRRGGLRLPLNFEALFCDRRRVLAMLGQCWLWHLVMLPLVMIEPSAVVELLSEGAAPTAPQTRLAVAMLVAAAAGLVFMAGFVKVFEQSLAHLKFGRLRILTLGYHVFLAGLGVWVLAPELSGTGMIVLTFVDRLVYLAIWTLLPFYYLGSLLPSWIKQKRFVLEG